MSPAADADAARPGPGSAPGTGTEQAERRRFLVAGAVFLGALVLLIAVAVIFSGGAGDPQTTATTASCAPDDVECRAGQESAERPGIIPQPGEGRAPDGPGDRGGWEQIAVFVALVAGVGLIIGLVVRSARRERARIRTEGPATGA